jgi:ParB family chromosome partitioning protein
MSEQIVYRDPYKLKPNPLNPRGEIAPDATGIEELAASIVEKGILQPLVITLEDTVIAGHRRRIAAITASLSQVPCIIRDLSPLEQQEVMLIENIQREDIDPLSEGRAYQRMIEGGATQNDIARKVGIHAVRVSERLIIARMPEDVGLLFGRLELPVSAAKPLSQIESEDDLRRIAGMIVSRKLAVESLERLIKREGIKTRGKSRNTRPYRNSERPRGIVRDNLVLALAQRRDDPLTIGDLLREMDFVCCACGMSGSEASRETLCAACPLASFLNRFAQIDVSGINKTELMAITAQEAK